MHIAPYGVFGLQDVRLADEFAPAQRLGMLSRLGEAQTEYKVLHLKFAGHSGCKIPEKRL